MVCLFSANWSAGGDDDEMTETPGCCFRLGGHVEIFGIMWERFSGHASVHDTPNGNLLLFENGAGGFLDMGAISWAVGRF